MAASEGCAESLFSYGTLQLEAVQVATFGRRLEGTSETLREFDLVSLEIEDPTVVGIGGKAQHPMARFTGRASEMSPPRQAPGSRVMRAPSERSRSSMRS
jgi:hypothetical protein